MSRCFPYPPGYFKIGATTHDALIESIKLQKETDKAKAERKREKREKKEKKQKDKDKRRDKKSKSVNNPDEHQHDSQKALQKAAEFKEVDNKNLELRTEFLERSDLTEEHGQPSTSHKPSYSSDSTQNSNKRKRDYASGLPEVATGKPIKIRLLKKLKGPDSSNETDGPLVQFASNHDNETYVSQNRTGIPVTSGSENNALNARETKSNDLNGLHLGRKQSAASSSRPSAPFSHLNNQTPVGHIRKTEVPVASRSRNSDNGLLNSSREPILQSCGRPVPTIPGPSSIAAPAVSASRLINVQGLCPDSNNTVVPSGTGKSPIDGIQVQPVNNGSTKSAEKMDPIVEATTQKVGPTRHEKKMLKKQSKYEKLVGLWVPPVLETQLPDDREDWLSRRGETVKSCSRNDVEACKESEVSSLWRPCARYLVEADIYALPYTVPF
ncbi:uncharacterized protein [Rutidosis leptorrhynchoides]|uniref:uncharacterized protein n=1 Tax=Rutidosis leptorrhynchoides TaxID=125765 RepID=UPI003A98E875